MHIINFLIIKKILKVKSKLPTTTIPFLIQQEPQFLEIWVMVEGGQEVGRGSERGREEWEVEMRTLPHTGNPLCTPGSPSLNPQEPWARTYVLLNKCLPHSDGLKTTPPPTSQQWIELSL